jgi:hypothetical protein
MLFPFFGPPIAQALRAVEAVVDVRRRARPPAMARRSQCAADVRVCTHRPHPDAEGQGHGGPLVSDGLARRCGQRLLVVEPRSAGCAPRLRPRYAGRAACCSALRILLAALMFIELLDHIYSRDFCSAYKLINANANRGDERFPPELRSFVLSTALRGMEK